jgi:hypothetical protein
MADTSNVEAPLEDLPAKETQGDVEEQGIVKKSAVEGGKMGSAHFGDTGFDLEHVHFNPSDVTWGKVLRAMCVHTPRGWAENFVGLLIVCLFLYFFLVGLEMALRMTRGPTKACIDFHCDGFYATSTSQIALNDPNTRFVISAFWV